MRAPNRSEARIAGSLRLRVALKWEVVEGWGDRVADAKVNGILDAIFLREYIMLFADIIMPKGDYLGEFEQFVLVALLRLGDDAYGVTIRREIERRTKRPTSAGSVYATLDRLQSHGMVSSRVGEATPQRGGKAKTYFRIEAAGKRALKQSRQAANAMWNGFEPTAGIGAKS
jgi:PadR family transcriptional regulator PadR